MVQKVLKIFLCIFTFITTTKCEAYNRKIVGGQTAVRGKFPYQVSIRMRANGQHNCGGAIISPRIIVTAAHCIYEHCIKDFFIVVGSNALSGGGQTYSLARMIHHCKYNPQTMSNDIALLKTTRDIQFSALVRPLPLMTGEVPRGASLVLSGWGLTSWPGNDSPKDLQSANLITIDMQRCRRALAPRKLFHTQICTFTKPGQGSCMGDSGGPLVYRGRLAGIVSWGLPCAAGYPDVFTKVSAFIQWIRQTARSMLCSDG